MNVFIFSIYFLPKLFFPPDNIVFPPARCWKRGYHPAEGGSAKDCSFTTLETLNTFLKVHCCIIFGYIFMSMCNMNSHFLFLILFYFPERMAFLIRAGSLSHPSCILFSFAFGGSALFILVIVDELPELCILHLGQSHPFLHLGQSLHYPIHFFIDLLHLIYNDV